jgi:hypothetical protein
VSLHPSEPPAPLVAELSPRELLDRLDFLNAMRGETAELVRDSFDRHSYAFGDVVFN